MDTRRDRTAWSCSGEAEKRLLDAAKTLICGCDIGSCCCVPTLERQANRQGAWVLCSTVSRTLDRWVKSLARRTDVNRRGRQREPKRPVVCGDGPVDFGQHAAAFSITGRRGPKNAVDRDGVAVHGRDGEQDNDGRVLKRHRRIAVAVPSPTLRVPGAKMRETAGGGDPSADRFAAG